MGNLRLKKSTTKKKLSFKPYLSDYITNQLQKKPAYVYLNFSRISHCPVKNKIRCSST